MPAVVQIVSSAINPKDEAVLAAQFALVCRHHNVVPGVQDLIVVFRDQTMSSERQYVSNAMPCGNVSAQILLDPQPCASKPAKDLLDTINSNAFIQFSAPSTLSGGRQNRISSDLRYVLSRGMEKQGPIHLLVV